MVEKLSEFFPELTNLQLQRFEKLEPLYREWNAQINVISRKDIDQFFTRHLLHSLSLTRIVQFQSGTQVLDVGTGGGFPGIPLAIFYPQVEFLLVDSIGKKIKVVQAIADELKLTNVVARQIRAEELTGKYHYVVSRAVTQLESFYRWINGKLVKGNTYGFYGLKGGDLSEEIYNFRFAFPHKKVTEYNLNDYFNDAFFATKKVVAIPN
ncbi:MAG: 16S rRNA (guanine(527)-N(7))-methyltransferase RsmG [Bacteroidetes bacterium]|nr:16S rRNA (guanine(527)-N(7))-methyltransferase RsmG [Bacteroidota bacterium]